MVELLLRMMVVVWSSALSRLSDRLEHAQTNAFLLHGADDTQADAGQADAGAGGDQHNST